MLNKVKKIANLVHNMGWRYIAYRSRYELLRRSGLLKARFPASPPKKQYLSLEEWRSQSALFFFKNRGSLTMPKNPDGELRQRFEDIKNGRLLLFNSVPADLGKEYDWVTNPDTGYRYDVKKHWTEIADYSKEAGDIKYVWEKSRFSYLYDIIRYDYHFGEDCAEFVFREILSWIKGNPVNCGPNYRCSQEMSLRVINWTFALHYYRNSPFLTDSVFYEMQYAIYWHMDHVYRNINFSRIAVRNNHAITETLALYMAGLLYPTLPHAAEWKKQGKKWFEEEIGYQVYEDGTYLQFSMNYHRIVVQLLTWGIAMSEKNGERFSDVVYDRAKKSLIFLRTCMVDDNGWLPNYGANDGALFFKLSGAHFRDYRPQLQPLAAVLGFDANVGDWEDMQWYGINKDLPQLAIANGTHSFPEGGYYIVREPDTLTFIKCVSYKDRPSQADNLHIDVWYKGENVLLDAGSYKYNTDDDTIRYFSGTQSHNTVMLDDKDQMLKGGRFIWYYWTETATAELSEDENSFIFSGTAGVFRYIKNDIVHKRTVVKKKGIPEWRVRDEVLRAPAGMPVKQLWHMPATTNSIASTEAWEDGGKELSAQVQEGWYSSLYGQMEKTREIIFSSERMVIETTIRIGEKA